MRQGHVFVKHIYAGILTETDEGKYIFDYDEAYIQDKNLPPVSHTMPKNQKTFHSNHLFPFFFNMLSEGENRRRQATLLHIDENDDFGILMATAQYDTPGCVTVQPL